MHNIDLLLVLVQIISKNPGITYIFCPPKPKPRAERGREKKKSSMVGVEGIEPSTSSLSEKRSTNELHTQNFLERTKETFSS